MNLELASMFGGLVAGMLLASSGCAGAADNGGYGAGDGDTSTSSADGGVDPCEEFEDAEEVRDIEFRISNQTEGVVAVNAWLHPGVCDAVAVNVYESETGLPFRFVEGCGGISTCADLLDGLEPGVCSRAWRSGEVAVDGRSVSRNTTNRPFLSCSGYQVVWLEPGQVWSQVWDSRFLTTEVADGECAPALAGAEMAQCLRYEFMGDKTGVARVSLVGDLSALTCEGGACACDISSPCTVSADSEPSLGEVLEAPLDRTAGVVNFVVE